MISTYKVWFITGKQAGSGMEVAISYAISLADLAQMQDSEAILLVRKSNAVKALREFVAPHDLIEVEHSEPIEWGPSCVEWSDKAEVNEPPCKPSGKNKLTTDFCRIDGKGQD